MKRQRSRRITRAIYGNLSFQIPRDVDPAAFPAWREFHFCKTVNDPAIYRYVLTRASKESPWKLRKAWRSVHGNDEVFTVK